ncbi:MAG: DNA polymerase III subunit delta [Rhizobiaceae bacterium]
MAQLKAHEVERYIAKPQQAHRIFLIYGPDIGMVSERAVTLAKTSGADLSDPFATIKLDADTAAADPQRIADEAYTVSMFGGSRLVWIRGSTQRNLAAALQPVLDTPPNECMILVEAGDLKKSSPLRSRIERSNCAIALPCYPDQQRSVGDVIDAHLAAVKISIDPDARQLLISMLGGDRRASRAEIDKLCLYASGSESIRVADVVDAVGDVSSLDIDVAIDAASIGDIAMMEHMLKRLFNRGTAVFSIVAAAQRHFQMLHRASNQMQHAGQPASVAAASIRPPVNFQRKDKITQALSIWSASGLERLLGRLETVSLASRARAELAIPLASTALLAIAIEASRNRRN